MIILLRIFNEKYNILSYLLSLVTGVAFDVLQ